MIDSGLIDLYLIQETINTATAQNSETSLIIMKLRFLKLEDLDGREYRVLKVSYTATPAGIKKVGGYTSSGALL
jgi:hypothetical protein